MKRALSISLTLLAWVLLIAYVTVASRYCTRQKDESLCKGLRVRIMDSTEMNFITSGMVRNWLVNEGIQVTERELKDINTLEIGSFVRQRGFVKSARAYVTLDGYLNIDLTQRRPIVRVNTVNGYNFYITDDGWILPQQSYFSVYVPIVTGHFDAPFPRGYAGSIAALAGDGEKKVGENYLFLHKLINFVKFISGDDFWNSFIVQINLVAGAGGTISERGGADVVGGGREPQVEIVPRAGDFIVMLGGLDGYREKLGKLMTFYNNGLAYEGWDSYRYINLKYKDQVICTK